MVRMYFTAPTATRNTPTVVISTATTDKAVTHTLKTYFQINYF